MNLDLSKLEVNYPAIWEYKIITKITHKIEDILFDTVNRDYKILKKNSSKEKKFISYTISLEVDNKEDKDAIFKRIHEHSFVFMVL